MIDTQIGKPLTWTSRFTADMNGKGHCDRKSGGPVEGIN